MIKDSERERGFGGILDFTEVRRHKMKDLTDEQNMELIRQTKNFEKAHLRAYLKGWKYFKYHGNWFEVKVKEEKKND